MPHYMRFIVLCIFILVAVASRWMPHAPNFTPVMAIALFSGAFFKKPLWAIAVPIVALLISDALLGGFYPHFWVVYLSFALVVLMGRGLFRRNASGKGLAMPFVVTSMASALIFYFITNFGVWAFSPMYAKSFDGLWACYINAIPFFRNTLSSQFFFGAILFGGYQWVQRYLPNEEVVSVKS